MLTNHKDIKAWLDSMDIENYTINDTGTVTVDGNVSDIEGDLTGLSGNVTNLSGNIDDAELTDEERKEGVSLTALID